MREIKNLDALEISKALLDTYKCVHGFGFNGHFISLCQWPFENPHFWPRKVVNYIMETSSLLYLTNMRRHQTVTNSITVPA
jgi:hypothetical protein